MLPRLKSAFPAAVLVLFAVAAPRPAQAQPAPPLENVRGVTCSPHGDRCRFELAPGLGVEGPRTTFAVDEDGRGFRFDGGEEQLTLRLCEPATTEHPDVPCVETFRGILRARVPQVGFLAKFVTPKPPLAAVLFDTGVSLATQLPELGPDVLGYLKEDAKYYVYYSQTAGLDAQIPGVEGVKLSTGADRTLFLFAHDGLFALEGNLVYFEGKLPGLLASKPEPDGPPDDSEPDEGPMVKIGLAGRPLFPFVPVETEGAAAGLVPFQGHLVMNGPVRINPLVQLDGTTVWNLDPDEDGDHPFEAAFYRSFDLEVGGNGVTRVEIPWLEIPALEIELSRASVNGRLSEADDRLGFSGWASDRNFLPGLPIPIRPRSALRTYGQMSRGDLAGSFVHAEGEMDIDAGALGRLAGVPLGSLLSRDAVLHVDASGLTVSGTTSSQIHPDVIFDGAAGLEVHVASNGVDSYLELRGRLIVGGEGLEEGVLRVSPQGIRVRGLYRTDQYPILVEGVIDSTGYVLQGSTELKDPIPGNAQDRANAVADLLQKEEMQRALEVAVAEAREYVSRRRQQVDTALAGVNEAQASVDHWAALLADYTSRRDAAWANYVSWRNRSCRWYNAVCKSRRAYWCSYYWGQYAYYQGLAATAYAAREAADAVLAQARAALTPLQTALENGESALALLERQLAEAILAVQEARARLAALPELEGAFVMVVTLTLRNGEASGQVVGRWNDVVLADGWVDLARPGRACLNVPGKGTLCAAL